MKSAYSKNYKKTKYKKKKRYGKKKVKLIKLKKPKSKPLKKSVKDVKSIKPNEIKEPLLKEKTKNIKRRYIKNSFAAVKRNRTVTLKTEELSGTSVSIGESVVPADGKTYAYDYSKQESGLTIGYGIEKADGLFYDGNLVLLENEKEIELGIGLPLTSLEFSLIEKAMNPYIKVIGGFSYDQLEIGMPDGIMFGSGLGFFEKNQKNYSFGVESFYKSKFFRGISASYGTEKTKEEQFGISFGIRYFLD